MAKTATKSATSSPQASAFTPESGPSDAQHSAAPQDGRPPVHTIRYRNIKAAIWENESANGAFFSVTITRSWQDERKDWHDTTSFNAGDLPTLAKAVNDAHSWIAWTQRQRKQPSRP